MTKFLRLPEVTRATGLSRSTIYERASRGEFPKPVPLGDRAVGWVADEIQAWAESRLARRVG